ncbi:uncharacterized protein LOC128682955 isoform X1 [Plodia interpunctella]|uniref:uncharacterized protein LOC128682955 isoform X1 n=1 Tax=Plodia interpunctella TaxID=58824 RepID=UPI002367B898|nr:uncharacterized protein LOC128682955 isoform X2 [Plodia interpunctella]
MALKDSFYIYVLCIFILCFQIYSDISNRPLAKPGFDALGMTAPVMVQMNPDGKWENAKPGNLDEERLRAVVQHLTNSQALSAAQSYCVQCAAENQKAGGGKPSNYVPVIMMPIYPADQCPFDMECEIEKMKDGDAKKTKKAKKAEQAGKEEKETEKKKTKKRGFVMQRLTDFDLLSQW